MSFNLKDFEVYLLKNDPKKFKNILGTEGYKMKLRELEGDKPKIDKTADTPKLSNSVPEVSTNIDTPETLNPDNLFYTNGKNGGTIKSDKGLYGFEGAGPVNNESGWGSQKQIYDKENGGQVQNPIDKISTNISNTAPYAIPQADKKLRKQISDLETQQNNFLAANGGYVNTENLPILSGYQEKIAELRKQLETASQPVAQTQESGYATLGDAYADSVFGQGTESTDAVVRQGGGTLDNEPLTLSAQGQTPGYVGLSDDDDDEKKSSEPESPIIPVAGGLFLNTETGEYINNYVDEGNEEESGEVEDPLIEEGNYYIENIQQYYLDKANRNISSDEFNEKYPEGILDEWASGLGKIIGWEACQDYIDSASQIVKKDEESTDGPYTIYSNPEETGDETEQDSISPIIPVYGGLYLNTETGEYINNYNDEGNEEAGQESGGSDDYYIDPDDYESNKDYMKALYEGQRDNNLSIEDLNKYLLANGFQEGAEGLAALNKVIEEEWGQIGVSILADEYDKKEEERQQSEAAIWFDLHGYDNIPTLEEVEAEYQRLIETPLTELTLGELETRKQIELNLKKEELEHEKELELTKAESDAEREFIEKMYDRKYETATKKIEDQFDSCREAFDELELIEKIGDTSNYMLTYENQSPQHEAILTGEQTATIVLASSQDVAQAYDQISNANYGEQGALSLINKAAGIVTQGLSDMITLNFNPSRSTDVFGRSLYIEKGYKIETISRDFTEDDFYWVENDFFIYDKEGNEVYHDCFLQLSHFG